MRHQILRGGAMQRFAVMALAWAMPAGCGNAEQKRADEAAHVRLEAAGRIDTNRLAAHK